MFADATNIWQIKIPVAVVSPRIPARKVLFSLPTPEKSPFIFGSALPFSHLSINKVIIVRIDDGQIQIGIRIEFHPHFRGVWGDAETDFGTASHCDIAWMNS